MSASAEYAAEVLQATLAGISTKDLVDELSKREGVNEFIIENRQNYEINSPSWIPSSLSKVENRLVDGTGPARILVVID